MHVSLHCISLLFDIMVFIKYFIFIVPSSDCSLYHTPDTPSILDDIHSLEPHPPEDSVEYKCYVENIYLHHHVVTDKHSIDIGNEGEHYLSVTLSHVLAMLQNKYCLCM